MDDIQRHMFRNRLWGRSSALRGFRGPAPILAAFGNLILLVTTDGYSTVAEGPLTMKMRTSIASVLPSEHHVVWVAAIDFHVYSCFLLPMLRPT